MNMFRFALHALAFVCATSVLAQTSVRIAPEPIPPVPGAILQVQSPDQGVLLPRTVIGSVGSPVEGLMIYDTVLHRFMYYGGSAWTALMPESAFQFVYADRDDDGYGDPFSALYAPSVPEGYVANDDDCSDEDPAVHPGQPEVCDDLDNDCDSEVDEGCDIGYVQLAGPAEIYMLPGASSQVLGRVFQEGVTDLPGQGSGISAQAGFGPDGSDPAMGGWTWTSAVYLNDVGGEDQYSAELTISAIGVYDHAYRFSPDAGTTWIYADLNGSQDGYQVGQAGHTAVLDDICNGIDDDGDGFTDENCTDLGQPCDGNDTDLCLEGTIVCLPNGDCGCNDDTSSSVEVCNGLDDDCDGETDEGCVDWCNLQFPPTISIAQGTTPPIYGRVFLDGVTNLPGQGPGISAEIGFGPDGSNPAMGGWTWFPAAFNLDVGNDDEYVGQLTVNMAGTFDYAYRFTGDGGVNWTYGDLDGSANGYSPTQAGHLEVN